MIASSGPCYRPARASITVAPIGRVESASAPEATMGPLNNLWAILSLPDNIPIVFMLALVGYFTYVSFAQARKNDRLTAEGRKDEILRRMQD